MSSFYHLHSLNVYNYLDHKNIFICRVSPIKDKVVESNNKSKHKDRSSSRDSTKRRERKRRRSSSSSHSSSSSNSSPSPGIYVLTSIDKT